MLNINKRTYQSVAWNILLFWHCGKILHIPNGRGIGLSQSVRIILEHMLNSMSFYNLYHIIRPPGTTVPDGLMFYRRCFLFLFFRHAFSEIPRPIALKLCHMVGMWLNFINWLQKFGGYSPKKFWGPKTCEISVNFWPLQTLIANISGTGQHIQNRKDVRTRKIPPAFDENSPVNFGPLTAWNYMWVWTH